MTADRLRLDLAELADEAIQIDLHDRVLTFSRRLGIQRAVAGSAAVLALVAAASGAAFAVLPDRAAPPMPPAASTPSASVTAEPTAEPSFDPSLEPTETTTPAVTEPPTLILGPDGLGALKLGMSKEQAAATGAVGAFDGRQGCQFASLAGSARDEAWAMHDPGRGIAAIEVPKGIRTVNGLEVGSSMAELLGVYPDVQTTVAGDPIDEGGRVLLEVPGNAAARYRIEVHEREIASIILQLADQGCYE